MAAGVVHPIRMRFWVFVALGLVGCIPTARVILPADASVGQVRAQPELVVEAPASSSSTAEAPDFGYDPFLPCTDPDDIAVSRPALQKVSELVYSLDDGPSPKVKEATAVLEALLTLKCFALAGQDLPEPLAFDTGFAFKQWWGTSGIQWLGSYLDTPMNVVVIPELPRPTYFLDGNEKSPLAPLLCSSKDGHCGAATAGWMRRAERRFEHPDVAPAPEKDPCPDEVAAAESQERWGVFRACRERGISRRATLPLGRFKSPNDGLFVVVENRSCQKITMYDLATGARMSANGCSMLNGMPRVEIGRVPVAAIREAAWMMMLGGVVKNDFRPVDVVALPSNVVPGRPNDVGSGGGISIGSVGSSSRRAVWSWFRPDKQGAYVGQISGERWRGPSYEANSHADELLAIADDAYDDSCAPPLPRSAINAITWSSPGPAVSNGIGDVASMMTHPNVPSLQALVIKQKTPPLCTTAL